MLPECEFAVNYGRLSTLETYWTIILFFNRGSFDFMLILNSFCEYKKLAKKKGNIKSTKTLKKKKIYQNVSQNKTFQFMNYLYLSFPWKKENHIGLERHESESE